MILRRMMLPVPPSTVREISRLPQILGPRLHPPRKDDDRHESPSLSALTMVYYFTSNGTVTELLLANQASVVPVGDSVYGQRQI